MFAANPNVFMNLKNTKKDALLFNTMTKFVLKIVGTAIFVESSSVYLIAHRIKVQQFSKHFAAYIVETSDVFNHSELIVLSAEILSGPPINAHKTTRGQIMIRPTQFC